VLAAEHLLDLSGLHLLIESVQRLKKLGVDRLAGFRPLHQDREVVDSLLEREDQIPILLEPAAALQNSLGFGLVFPEVGRGGARLEAGQLIVRACGFKDNSEDRRLVCSNLRNAVSGRRLSPYPGL
jgi:hypothetical protein